MSDDSDDELANVEKDIAQVKELNAHLVRLNTGLSFKLSEKRNEEERLWKRLADIHLDVKRMKRSVEAEKQHMLVDQREAEKEMKKHEKVQEEMETEMKIQLDQERKETKAMQEELNKLGQTNQTLLAEGNRLEGALKEREGEYAVLKEEMKKTNPLSEESSKMNREDKGRIDEWMKGLRKTEPLGQPLLFPKLREINASRSVFNYVTYTQLYDYCKNWRHKKDKKATDKGQHGDDA